MMEPNSQESNTRLSFAEFQGGVRELFFHVLSDQDSEHAGRYLREAPYHHTMNVIADTVVVAATVLDAEVDMDSETIATVVRGIAVIFGKSAEEDRRLRAAAEQAPAISAADAATLLDESNKLG